MGDQSDILVVLHDTSPVQGDVVTVEVVHQVAKEYSQMQADIFHCGVENPKEAWSKGTETKLVDDEHLCEFTLETKDLSPNYYEVKRIRFHTPKEGSMATEAVIFHGGTNFPRTFFEVISQGERKKSIEEIKKEILAFEDEFETYFNSGINISNDNGKDHSYRVFTFVSGLMVTKVMRLGKCELIPFRGLDTKDRIDLVNDYYKQDSEIDLEFAYTQELSEQIRNNNPVCVIQFPLIFAETEHAARTFCFQESLLLTEVLSIYRGGSGRVFAIVAQDLTTNNAQLYTENLPYIGNLLGGSMAGENADSIKNNFQKLKTKPSLRYYLSLFKEARAEFNVDFQYLRYWQILEMIAESKRFDRSKALIDFLDNPILNKKGQPIKIKSSEARIYELIKQHFKIGGIAEPNHKINRTEYNLWKFVECWYGMRNAASHFGGFRYDDPYQKKSFGDYQICEKVYKDQNNSNNGFVTRELVETSKLIIAREINLN